MTCAFSNFFDSADMTGCFASGTSLGAINREAAAHGLYFPLFLDESQSLAAHLLHGGHLPASHRFGMLADNILGINFRLSNGTRVRLGGRAIKNCTGFDITRFLLNSRHDFGEATDFVLRLRALASPIRWFGFRATDQDIEKFRRALNRSPWWHTLECVDVEMQSASLILWIGIRGSEPATSYRCEHTAAQCPSDLALGDSAASQGGNARDSALAVEECHLHRAMVGCRLPRGAHP